MGTPITSLATQAKLQALDRRCWWWNMANVAICTVYNESVSFLDNHAKLAVSYFILRLQVNHPFFGYSFVFGIKPSTAVKQFEKIWNIPILNFVTDKTARSTQKIWLVSSIRRWWICHQCCAWATLTSVTWGVPKRTSKEHNKNYLETASWCSLHFPSIIFEGDVQGHHTATTAVAPEAGNSHSNAARWTRNYAIQCFERYWHR